MRKIMLIEENLLSGLFSIYLFVVNTFTIVGIVKWLNKTRDSEILSNMYFIIFQTMEHIQIRLHGLVSSLYAFGDETKDEIVTFMPKSSAKPDCNSLRIYWISLKNINYRERCRQWLIFYGK